MTAVKRKTQNARMDVAMGTTSRFFRRSVGSLMTVLALAWSAPPAGAAATSADRTRLVYPYAPYNEGKMDPQLTGWPLSEAQVHYIEAKPAGARWPGNEPGGSGALQALDMVPVTPIAGGGKGYEAELKQSFKFLLAADEIDILLVGDSITGAWEGYCEERPFIHSWTETFGQYKTINLGKAGENTAGTLWRMDHAPFAHLKRPPKVCILQIGHNNMYWLHNGVSQEAVTQGIVWCAKNLRARFPETPLILVNVFPTKDVPKPGVFDHGLIYARKRLNELNLPGSDPMIHMLDLWDEMLNPDGTQKQELFTDGVHLTPKGYALWAARLKPVVEKLLTTNIQNPQQ
jgi:lysophospholipase L1-like esterase